MQWRVIWLRATMINIDKRKDSPRLDLKYLTSLSLDCRTTLLFFFLHTMQPEYINDKCNALCNALHLTHDYSPLIFSRFSFQNTIFPHIADIKNYPPLILKLEYLKFPFRKIKMTPF